MELSGTDLLLIFIGIGNIVALIMGYRLIRVCTVGNLSLVDWFFVCTGPIFSWLSVIALILAFEKINRENEHGY